MNLEHLKVAIRPRRDWEAVDLGILMARQWWWPLQKAWLLVTAPLLIICLIAPLHWAWWLTFCLWWFKPLYERPLLMILSQAVFGSRPSTREVIRAAPRLALMQIIASLTWRRLSPSRSMDLPVVQLEGLGGAERSRRLSVLHRDDASPATWLTILGVHIESFLMLSMLGLLVTFIPEEVAFDLWSFEFWFDSRPGHVLQVVLYYLSMALVAPFYAACGFSLYLNRRVKLEGWDIEIAFKRMRQKRGFGFALMTFVSGMLMTSSLMLHSPASHAQDDESPLMPDSANEHWQIERALAKDEITRITSGEDFHQKEMHRVLKPQEEEEAEEFDWGVFESLAPLFRAIGSTFQALRAMLTSLAGIAELILWTIVLVGIFFIASRYGGWFRQLRGTRRPSNASYRPTTLFGMDVQKTSLPDDVGHSATSLWREGQRRAALALLYRATLAQLLHHGLPLTDGSTEQECLNSARQHAQRLSLPTDCLAYFAELTQVWQQFAYGHIEPDGKQVETLCHTWDERWLGARTSEC